MDNIIVTAVALRRRRRTVQAWAHKQKTTSKHKSLAQIRAKSHEAAFNRWVESFRLKYRILYRITGIRKIEDRPKLRVKVQFMPYLIFDHDTTAHNFFGEPFAFYVEFRAVRNCRDNWVSAYATIKQYQTQPLTMQLPSKYHSLTIEEVMPKVIFPAGVREHYCSDAISGFKSLAQQNFYTFHLFFHMADDPTKRYGIIDQMWDQYHHALDLEQFPELDLPLDDLKSQTASNAPANLPSLDDFFAKTSFLHSSQVKIPPPIS